jgi:hypothetical protein
MSIATINSDDFVVVYDVCSGEVDGTLNESAIPTSGSAKALPMIDKIQFNSPDTLDVSFQDGSGTERHYNWRLPVPPNRPPKDEPVPRAKP